jgi:hypothetical protein
MQSPPTQLVWHDCPVAQLSVQSPKPEQLAQQAELAGQSQDCDAGHTKPQEDPLLPVPPVPPVPDPLVVVVLLVPDPLVVVIVPEPFVPELEVEVDALGFPLEQAASRAARPKVHTHRRRSWFKHHPKRVVGTPWHAP